MADGGIETQFVTFGLDNDRFAAPVAQVREILDYRPAAKIPNGPAYLLGMIDVRGQGVPALDLRVRLGLGPIQPTSNTRILVLDVMLEDRILTLGVVADRVFEVITIASDEIKPAPDVGVAWQSDYIAGVVRRSDGFIVLMDIGQLLSSSDQAVLPTVSGLGFAA